MKNNLIDWACENTKIKSLVDLGCTWHVDGTYGLYAKNKYQVERVILVDFLKPAIELNNVEFKQGLFHEVADEIDQVDAILMFDILLHQVNPDWKQLLKLYAPKTKNILIYNPQYVQFEETTRLTDLGRQKYFEVICHKENDFEYPNLFGRPDEKIPGQDVCYKDSTNFWQWGITDSDLDKTMEELGFELNHFIRGDIWTTIPGTKVESHGFVYGK